MSRSNPTDNTPNPATRWFEWSGSEGHFRYYDKDHDTGVKDDKGNPVRGQNVQLPPDFTFIVLDRLSSVRGWHEASESGIVSNEVRDTRAEPMLVRSFKGGKIAQGFYADIRDKVAAAGGRFTVTCYCAFKDAGKLVMGAVQFKGAALSAWFEFEKKNRKSVFEQAVRVKGATKDKKGKVEFFVPVFSLVPVSAETNKEATFMDVALQEYLKSYFSRTRIEQVEQHPAEKPQADAPEPGMEPPTEAEPGPEPGADDVPF